MNLGLSAEALAVRNQHVHAGHAQAIMDGRCNELWRIFKGLLPEPDFYDSLAWFIKKHVSRDQMEMKRVMGQYTEPFNLFCCQEQTGRQIEYYSGNPALRAMWQYLTGRPAHAEELRVSKQYPWMACNLDGMTTTAQGYPCVIDAKHVGRADDPMILRYTAAGTHQATVMGCDYWALSVFVGNSKWEYIEQEIDPLYQADLISRTREFWGYVERGEEPQERSLCDVCGGSGKTSHVIYTFDGDSDRQIPDREEIGPCEECDGTGWIGWHAVLPPKPQPRLRELHVPVSEGEVFGALMRENNWLGAALTEARAIAETDGAAKRHAIARKDFAGLVPVDVGLVEWGLFKAKRDKAGALRINVGKAKGDEEC